jgi:hypothetical protein
MNQKTPNQKNHRYNQVVGFVAQFYAGFPQHVAKNGYFSPIQPSACPGFAL